MRMIRWLVWLPALLALAGCGFFDRTYEQTFDDDRSWDVGNVPGISGTVQDGRLLVSVDYPLGRFWSVAGRSDLADGLYAIEGTVVEGSAEAAFGLILRADPSSTNFHFVAVSADGTYSVGLCRNRCDRADEFLRTTTPPWIPSPAIATGLGAVNRLEVEASGRQLAIRINGQAVDTVTAINLLERGDVGLYAETFDSGATIAFDNLRFVPADQREVP